MLEEPSVLRSQALLAIGVLLLVLQPLDSRAQVAPTPDQSITFAQLTDAHIFDDGWREATSDAMWHAADDRRALQWAIDRINELVASGVKIDFVVYTGDWGLQNVDIAPGERCRAVRAGPQPGLPLVTLSWAVDEVAKYLKQLSVRRIFLVPGNNDLIDEKVTDAGRHDCFVAKLQEALRFSPVEVVGLDTAGVDINGFRLVGLNTASFKASGNYQDDCSGPAAALLRRACPRPQVESLRANPAERLVIFTHVPDLRDPFRKHPAWEIEPAVRAVWEGEACRPRVLGIFAGHFHASDRALYGNSSGTKTLTVSTCVAEKTWVAPPLAIKNQVDRKPGARGFFLATVKATGVALPRGLYWFEPEAVAAPVRRADLLARWTWPLSALTVFLLAAIGLVWASRSASGKYRDVKALMVVVLFLDLALAAVWLAKRQLDISDSPTLIALLVLPLVLYGVISGRLTEFTGPGGWGAKFREAAQQPVDLSLAPIDLTNTEIDTLRKSGERELQNRLDQGLLRESRPLVLTLTLGQGGYDASALESYLRELSRFANFRFVAFADAQNRLVGYVPHGTLARALVSTPGAITELLAAVHRADAPAVRAFRGMITESISRRTTNAEALQAMDRLGVDALMVTDENTGTVLGLVDRERILSRMVAALVQAART